MSRYYEKTEAAVTDFLKAIGSEDKWDSFGSASNVRDAFTGLVNAEIVHQSLNKAYPEMYADTVARIRGRLQSSVGSSPQYNEKLGVAFEALKKDAQTHATTLALAAEKNTDLPPH